MDWFVSRWTPRGSCTGPRRPLSNASEFDRERLLPPQARRGCERRRRDHAGRAGLERRSRFLDAVGAKMPRKKHTPAKNSQYSQYSQWSQWSICPSQPFMRKSSPMDAQPSAGSRAGATPRAAKRRLFWSAPAERSADGAFGRAGRPGTADAARAKAVSRLRRRSATARRRASLATALQRRPALHGWTDLSARPRVQAPRQRRQSQSDRIKPNQTKSNRSNQNVQRGDPRRFRCCPRRSRNASDGHRATESAGSGASA